MMITVAALTGLIIGLTLARGCCRCPCPDGTPSALGGQRSAD
jgi:hypothetical protein